MLVISVKSSLNEAWLKTLEGLFCHPRAESQKYSRDMPALIKIEAPDNQEAISPLFPMPSKDVRIINEYLVTGAREGEVVHEWTKIYRQRIFSSPFSQIEFIIDQLKAKETSGRAQVSLWDKNIDQTAEIAPCTQILWFRRRGHLLEMHTHAHSSNAWNKLLMNIHEFHALQIYVAKRVGLGIGSYYHFIDSCHVSIHDEENILNSMKIERNEI